MRISRTIAPLLAVGVLALAGCGGSDDDNDSGSGGGGTTTSGGGNSARPADQILADAGLQICNREEEQIAQSTIGPGLQLGVKFNVAKNCGGKSTSPNVIYAFQFSDRESVDAGAQKAQQVYSNGVVMQSGALVIVALGPQKDENAAAVGKAYEESTGAPVETVS